MWLACVPMMFLASCANVTTNARLNTEGQPQANDLLVGSGALAKATFRATAIAAVRQPVTTVKLGFVNLWHRPRELFSGYLPEGSVVAAAEPVGPGTVEFEHMLDERGFPRAESGSLKWLVDGKEFFPEFERQITTAKESIHVQVYIFDNDDIAVRYADLLKQRAGEVNVRVLFDDMGSAYAHTAAPETLGPVGFVPPKDIHDYIQKDSKASARRTLNPWFVADHTKLVVIDQRTAMIGGMNIGREYYSEWHDLMMKVEGPVVKSLSREFKRAWRKAGPWGDFALFRSPAAFHRPGPVSGGIPLRVLRTDPAEGRYDILDTTLLAIQCARKRIWIETPYFSHDDIEIALAAAAKRGVDVHVILPAKGDSALMDAGNMATARVLMRAGVKVYRYPKMTHMKAMICDDWATVGSANLDTLSMRINRELNLSFSDRKAVQELERRVFIPDLRASRRLQMADTASFTGGVAEIIADQL